MGRLAKRLSDRGVARLSRSCAVSPTQWAAPTEIGVPFDASLQPLRRAVGAGAIGGRQQREQLVGLPAHEHVGVAQAPRPARARSLGRAQRHDDPHEREVAPVAHALGHQPAEQQAADVRARKDEAPVHSATLAITSTARAKCSGEMRMCDCWLVEPGRDAHRLDRRRVLEDRDHEQRIDGRPSTASARPDWSPRGRAHDLDDGEDPLPDRRVIDRTGRPSRRRAAGAGTRCGRSDARGAGLEPAAGQRALGVPDRLAANVSLGVNLTVITSPSAIT